jgi:AAA15 family ATPase/GTPase
MDFQSCLQPMGFQPIVFEFAPITILTGTNSSGKSSLIKAILLFKQNFQSLSSQLVNPNHDKANNVSSGNFRLIKGLRFGQSLNIGNVVTIIR